jgi:hypothetical protein
VLHADVRRALRLLFVGVTMLLLVGCGGAPGTIGPVGVDELTIPSPSPDPADFVARVDNRWFPLPEGARWVYRVENDAPSADSVQEVIASVTGRHPVVAGVATTEYLELSRAADGRLLARARSWYAQDRAGNVWLLGRRINRPLPQEEGSGERDHTVNLPQEWRAGDPGVGAGLAMPAAPRLGDGFWYIRVPGSLEVRLRVTSVDATITTFRGPATGVVELEVQDSLATRMSYAPGLGLVAVDSGATRMSLASAELPESG